MGDPDLTTTPDAPQLDRYQQAVVDADDRSIRVVAPAGSGKTETLARRVQARIAAGIQAHRILLLTFDNNARQSILDKLQRLGVPKSVNVNTLNAFGLHLLTSRFQDERRQVVKEVYFPNSPIINELVTEYGHSVMMEMIGKIKNEAIDPRTIEESDLAHWAARNREHLLRNLDDDPIVSRVQDSRFGRELAREMRYYEQFLESRGGIDFDDQKLRPLVRLRNEPSALAELQSRFDDVIVDEFQDINRLDVELIDLIAAKSTLLITGDDDQAIYGFRGATADFLISPEKQLHRTFAPFELSINYRCPPRVLQVAGNVIRHNEHRIHKEPRADKRNAGEVEWHRASDIDSECRWIADRMNDLLTEKPCTAAVLVRRRAQLVRLQAAMIEAGTPYRVPAHEDIRISWSLAKRALQLAPLSVRSVPDASIRAEIVRIFAQARSLSAHRTDRLIKAATENDFSFPGPELLQQLHEREQRYFANGIKALTGQMSVVTRLGMLDPLINTELRTYMDGGKEAARDRGDKDTSRLSGLIDIATVQKMNMQRLGKHIDELLEIQRTALRSNAPVIELCTCHGAKGREWDIVCIPHCNQGIFPDARSNQGLHLEAERKLFYVSMTRAAEHLIMTWSGKNTNGGPTEPSDFLIETELVPRPKPRQFAGTQTFAASKEASAPTPQGGRDLGPTGTWSMRIGATRPSESVPRFITLVTPRERVMEDATDHATVEKLAEAVSQQEREFDIALYRMDVRYPRADGAAIVPLQLELALRGIPFSASPVFTNTDLFQAAISAWTNDSPPQIDHHNRPLFEAMARTMARLTESDDTWVWLDRIDDLLADEELGIDEDGVRFLPQ